MKQLGRGSSGARRWGVKQVDGNTTGAALVSKMFMLLLVVKSLGLSPADKVLFMAMVVGEVALVACGRGKLNSEMASPVLNIADWLGADV